MSRPPQSGLSDNAAAAIAYITVVPAIYFLITPPYNSNPYVRFHAWQSIFLNVAAFFVSVMLSIVFALSVIFGAMLMLSLSRLVWLGWILVWILCALNALSGKRFKLPILGAVAEKQARI